MTTIWQLPPHYLAPPPPAGLSVIWGGVFRLGSSNDPPLPHSPPPLCPQSSPPSFCAAGRTPDLNAILGVIDAAQQFISVAVMSYLPATEFRRPDRSCQPRG